MMNIKNHLIKYTFAIILLVVSFASCDNEVKNINKFALDKEDITIGEAGGVEQLVVTSSEKWVALSSEPWVLITPANGVATTECSIVIDSTLINDMRTATIRFSAEGQEPLTVTVRQTGFDKIISIEDTIVDVEASALPNKRNFTTKVTTNVEFKIEIEYEDGLSNWLSASDYKIELDRGSRPRTANIKFDWKMNPDPVDRKANVRFIPINPGDELEKPVVLTVIQKAAPKIDDNIAGDSLALLTISSKLRSRNSWDPSESLRNWDGVVLWEKTDEDLPSEDAIGRVREVSFVLNESKETIPQEVRFLKYVEYLSIYSNANTMLLSIDLGSEVTELTNLKHLQIDAYGLVSLPDEFKNLGAKLETLSLSSNNFTTIPSVLTKENFPKLKSFMFTGNRRWTLSDLRKADTYQDGIGLNVNTASDNSIRRLLLWDTLEDLRLSFNYIEGQIPDFKVGEEGVKAYTQADVDAFGGDTIQYLADNNIPKILPNIKRLGINLNFMTGDVPQWLLYHPHLLDWFPDVLVFNQMEYGIDSKGKTVKFDNAPNNYEYYYTAFPEFRKKYEFDDVYEDEE